MTIKNTTAHSQAIEIAIDAHASRLIRDHSPEEAFVDYSSLGPYVTECLRSSDANTTNDLIELLEGQCQMTRDTASMVIANIDRAVRTGDVLVAGDDTNQKKNLGESGTTGDLRVGTNNYGGAADDMSSGSETKRARSKSLGSEPLAYDGNFLGKILQDAMIMPSVHSSSTTPPEVDLSAAFGTAATIDISATNEHNPVSGEGMNNMGILRASDCFDPSSLSSASFAADNPTKARNKQRSVTFDETRSSTSFLLYDSTSSPALGPLVMKEDDDINFDPLGGILDALDMEEDGGQQQQQQQQRTHFSVMESILETSFATVDSTKSDGQNNMQNEKTILAPISPAVLPVQGGGVSGNPLPFPQCQLISDPNDKEAQTTSQSSSSSPPSDFPSLGESGDTKSQSQKQNGTSGKGRKSKKKKEANDLAAALFRPSRSRSNSLLDNSNQRPRALSLASSSMLRPSSAESPFAPAPSSGNGVGMGSLLSQSLENAAAGNANITTSPASDVASSSPSAMANNSSSIQSEVISTTQLLLTLNSHLGTEAATLASQLTDGDLNLAQYLIEAARSDSSSDARANAANNSNRRSRICRHELRGTCYRSDCPYSHDLGGVTCLFWLRGRCRGESCRFMHGFAESLLDGISEEYLNEKREQDAKKKEEEGKKIQTGNLLQHNQNQWSGAPAGKNLSKSLPTQGFLFLSPSQGGMMRQ